ncbi:MAG: tetratricopeptide repeat protein [Bacteroidales bacterium]
MKKGVIFLIIIFASQLIAGQSRYDGVLKAVSLSARGENEEAATVLSGLISTAPDADLMLLRGEIYLKSGRLKEAKTDFMAAENMKPGSGMYGLARCAAAGGDAKGAVAYLEAHLKSPFRKSEPEIMLDSTFGSIQSSPEWKSLWKKEWYKGYERKNWEINHYLNIGKTDLAEETWRELSAEYSDMPVTDYCNARIMISKGQYREAASLLEPLAAKQDAPVSYLLALAEARAGEGNYYAAATVYGRLINAEYPDPQLLVKRASMLLKAGDRDAAKADLGRYLSLDPDNSEALGLIGRTYAEEGAIYEALPYLNNNIEQHPGEARAFSLRGDAWLAARTWDKAAEDYTMSLDIDPENGPVNLNLGIALINTGNTGDACHYLRKAKELGEKDATRYLSKYCIK